VPCQLFLDSTHSPYRVAAYVEHSFKDCCLLTVYARNRKQTWNEWMINSNGLLQLVQVRYSTVMGELRLHCARHIISECVTWTDPYPSDGAFLIHGINNTMFSWTCCKIMLPKTEDNSTIFQCEVVPHHRVETVCEWLNEHFLKWWIGKGGW
jgi:hypothetical protein